MLRITKELAMATQVIKKNNVIHVPNVNHIHNNIKPTQQPNCKTKIKR